MQPEYLSEWTRFTNSALKLAKELGEINTKAIKKLSEQQFDLISRCLDTAVKQLNLLNEVKGYKELLTAQTKLATEYNEKVLDTVRKTTQIFSEAKDEMAAWIDKNIEGTVTSIRKFGSVPFIWERV
jgi:phasin family protein